MKPPLHIVTDAEPPPAKTETVSERIRPCRFCGSPDVSPNRAAQSDFCCRPCSTRAARNRRERAGKGKPRLAPVPGELWKVIPGCAQAHEVSNLGRVRNAIGREMRQKPPGKFPYPSVTLRTEAGKITKAVHRLVGDAFLGPRPPGMVTRHLNGVTTDNRAWLNLVWGTPAENCADTARHGRLPRGEGHCCATLTDEQVVAIRRRHVLGESAAEIAADLSLRRRTVWDAMSGRTWKHLSMEAADAA